MTAGKFLIAAALIASAAPALARNPAPTTQPIQSPTSVPEPGDAGLFLLGAIGVAAGRYMHARRAKKRKSDDASE